MNSLQSSRERERREESRIVAFFFFFFSFDVLRNKLPIKIHLFKESSRHTHAMKTWAQNGNKRENTERHTERDWYIHGNPMFTTVIHARTSRAHTHTPKPQKFPTNTSEKHLTKFFIRTHVVSLSLSRSPARSHTCIFIIQHINSEINITITDTGRDRDRHWQTYTHSCAGYALYSFVQLLQI